MFTVKNAIASLTAAGLLLMGSSGGVSAQSDEPIDDLGACPLSGVVETGFADVEGSAHLRAIECLVAHDITQGVSLTEYAPTRPVTRGQMASFLVRLIAATDTPLASPTRGQPFSDAVGTTHVDAIVQLHAAGIARGSDDGLFKPSESVRRDQMASFLVRTVEWIEQRELSAAETGFGDVTGDAHREAIAKAFATGITRGTTATTYAPDDPVRRDQMASFLARSITFVGVGDPTLSPDSTPVPVTPPPGGSGGDGAIVLDVDVPGEASALIEVQDSAGAAPTRAVVAEQDGEFTVTVAPGSYRVTPRPVNQDGEWFVAGASQLVSVEAGGTTTSTVTYTRSEGAQDLRVTDLTSTSVSVEWTAVQSDGTTVWRAEGVEAPERPGDGTEVSLATPISFEDQNLEPETSYSYSIFVPSADGSIGVDDVAPVSVTVHTEGSDPTIPVFALSPNALIIEAQQFTPYSTDASLVLSLSNGVSTPVPGQILVVQATPELPGGFLGRVVSISEDGRWIELESAPMTDAFDLYRLDVDSFDLGVDVVPTAPPMLEDPDASSVFLASASKVGCGDVSDSITVTPAFSQDHDGYANITIDKYNIKWLPDVPYAVDYDVGYETTLDASVKVEGSTAVSCGIDLPRFAQNLTVFPVPVAIDVKPVAEVTVFASGTMENLGGSVTAGFDTNGRLGLDGSASVDGDLTLEPTVYTPTFTNEAGLGLEIGGDVLFGPGAATSGAGIVVGVKGNFSPLDATATGLAAAAGSDVDACLKLDANLKVGLSASLGAWVSGYSQDFSVTIDQLQGNFDYPGTPYFFPDGVDCTKFAGDTPTTDVVGDGVTVTDDDIVGDPGQFGKVTGFVPGQDTWVLSTGNISDVVGSSSEFASTDLGLPGDDDLTALAGDGPTFDAVSYTVTVVPDAGTLVVRYVFASEEYPEFVGSVYNDVMAVFVDGQNCAFVPGTDLPVSVNNVNADLNPQYFVDNTTDAAGYDTTMDGLTVPLECRVPVTAGEPVTVKIAVADVSDGIYDSAVALLDGGIFAE